MNEDALSPSLRGGDGPAFELKFLLGEEAVAIENWARANLTPDPHGRDGRYLTTSLYCDTPGLDVFHRNPGFKRNKYRLRRYETGEVIHLERKTRKGDQVRKRRDVVPLEHLPMLSAEAVDEGLPFFWFVRNLRKRGLVPAARVGYERTAFHGPGVRLTIDRHVSGERTAAWDLSALSGGKPLLHGRSVLELKYQGMMPDLFRDLLATLPGRPPGGVSKYRLCMRQQGGV